MPTPKPEPTDFQLRRRRAAKLTQFFGVDYKQIIYDILESIEKGVEEDRKKGTLQPDEVEVRFCALLQYVLSLLILSCTAGFISFTSQTSYSKNKAERNFMSSLLWIFITYIV